MTQDTTTPTVTQADREAAMRIACKVVLDYGEGDEREQSRARNGNLWRDHPAFVAALEGMAHTRLAHTDEVARTAREYAAERDEEHWCQRVKYGQCSLLKCNKEGGWQPGQPSDYSLATCARYRLEQALEGTNNATG